MPKLATSIPPFLKKPILLHPLIANMAEQVNTHPKTATKVALGESWIFSKIIANQLVVPLNPLPPQLSTTNDRTTILRPLRAHSQNHQHILLLF
jgi:hypothetical protein